MTATTFRICMLKTVALAGTHPTLTFCKGRVYRASLATNQPRYQERGLVFVEKADGASMLIEAGDYRRA
jgi:hypothetical protein